MYQFFQKKRENIHFAKLEEVRNIASMTRSGHSEIWVEKGNFFIGSETCSEIGGNAK